MRKILWPCALIAAASLAVIGAGSQGSGPPWVPTPVRAVIPSYGAGGYLIGAIVFRGNVPRSARKHRYHRGWVEVRQQGQLVAKQWVKNGHTYHFTLLAGTYDIAGYTRWGTCRGSANVPPDRRIRRNVYCVFH